MGKNWYLTYFCLCWGLTSQSTIFQLCRDGATASWVINQYFRGVKCLAQGHNTAAVGLEPPTSCSGVRHSTSEPPRSPNFNILITFILIYLRRLTTKPIKWHVRPAKTQINLGIRPVWSESSLSTWGRLKSLAIIRAHSEASDQTGWSESSLGANVILLVLTWGGSFYFVSLASTILISANSRRFISWNSPKKRGFLCIHAHVCLRLLCRTADE